MSETAAMTAEPWREQYAALLEAYIREPCEHLMQQAADLGRSLYAAAVPPEDVVAAHMDCLAQLCARQAGHGGAPQTGVTPLFLELMMAYGLGFRRQWALMRELTERTEQLARTVAELSQAEEALGRARDELERRVAERTADLAVANEQLTQEIVERKQAERDLKEITERLHTLIDAIPDIAYFKDSQFRHLAVNKAFENYVGVPREEARGKTNKDLLPPSLYAHCQTEDEALLETGEAVLRREVRWTQEDGTEIYLETTKIPLRDESGRPIGLVGVTRDITERKRAEEETRRQQTELAHVSRLATMGEMATGLAHELNQPLTAVSNYATACLLMLRGPNLDAAELTGTLEQLCEQNRRAGEIIRRLRNFVRRRDAQRSTVDIGVLVRETLGFLDAEARQKGITIRVGATDRLSPVCVDAIQIQQVLLNLLRNAFEAMENTQLDVRNVTITMSGADDQTIEVGVRDTGCGLCAEGPERIFDAFVTTKPTGMGMGLAISRSIIESHGGRLWAAANPEVGATFRFRLPAADSDGVRSNAD